MLAIWIKDLLRQCWQICVFVFLVAYMAVFVGLPLVSYLRG